MNEMFFKILNVQKKMESNKKMQTYMKWIGFGVVFVIFVCSFSQADTMKMAWLLSIPIIGLLFGIDVYYMKQNKKQEFKLYEIKKEDLQSKKELAEITGEYLPDWVLNQEIKMPSDKLSLPILYYAIILILDIFIKVLMIH